MSVPTVTSLPGVCTSNTYTLKEEVASGAFGCVFRASCVSKDSQSQKDVAIKLVPLKSKDGIPNYHDVIKREVLIVNRLRHPHVMAFTDYVVHHGYQNDQHQTVGAIGLVMDLATCSLQVPRVVLTPCLRAVLTATEWIPVQTYITGRQNMDEASVRWLFQQLMLAMDYCHGKFRPRCA
jgi:serine/threonine protein kinase